MFRKAYAFSASLYPQKHGKFLLMPDFPDLRKGFRFAVSAPYFRRNTDAIAVNVEALPKIRKCSLLCEQKLT